MSKQTAAPTRPNSAQESSSLLSSHVCIQRQAIGPGVEHGALPLVKNVLNSPGRPLDAAVRDPMERHFGHDFSGVRIHTDQAAAESAGAIHANAYAAGSNLVFAAGKYALGSSAGHHLIAHELAHVVQQSNGPVAGTPIGGGFQVSTPGDEFERQANRMIADGARAPAHPALGPGGRDLPIQRDTATDWAIAGGIIGGIGAAAGIGALIYAILQYGVAKHPPAQASPTGGLTLTHGSFNTMQQQAKGSDDASLKGATTHNLDILYVDTPYTKADRQQNHFTVGLQWRSDGHNIVEGFTEEEQVSGYRGGSDGATATVSFNATQVFPLPSAAGAATAASPTPATGAQDTSAAGATASPSAAPQQQQQQQQQPAAASEVAEVMVRCTGTNATPTEMQRFKAAWRVSGDGNLKAEAGECKVTQGDSKDMEIMGSYVGVGIGRSHGATAAATPAPATPAPAQPESAPPTTPATGPGDYPMPQGYPAERMA